MKIRKKRILPVFLALVISISCLSGCGKSDYDAEKQALHDELYGAMDIPTASAANISLFNTVKANFSLAYSRTDSLNPYRCKSTLNATVASLIFDKLFILTPDYEVEPIVARSFEMGDSTIKVTVRTGLVFSDGSPLTVDDVEYSFYAAKRSDTRYTNQLKNIKGLTKQKNTLTFQLGDNDPLAYMLLDFPIIKKESDVMGQMPIGSGRYVYVTDKDEGMFLEVNEKWYDPDKPSIDRISLNSMPTIESIVHSIEIGTISYFITDLRDGYPSRVNSNYAAYDINNLIYLGVNTNDARLLNIDIRTAISDAIDRESVVTKAFGGRGYAATGPLSIAWKTAANAQSGLTVSDKQSAQFLLNNAGYASTDDSGYRYDGLGNYLSFEILVSEGNDMHVAAARAIASQLSEVGISGIVTPLPSDEFKNAVRKGEYQLYVAEYAMTNNMDFTPLLKSGSGLYTGSEFEELNAARTAFYGGTGKIDDYLAMTEKYLPFIPVCHRQGLVCYSRALDAKMNVSESDPFYGMKEWNVIEVNLDETLVSSGATSSAQ